MNNHTSLQNHANGSGLTSPSGQPGGSQSPKLANRLRQWFGKAQGCELVARRLRGLPLQ